MISLNIIRIKKRELLDAGIPPSFDTRVYFHPVKFIGDIFWLRFEKMLQMAEPRANEVALDFGCGHGLFLPTLSKYYKKVAGIDVKIFKEETRKLLSKHKCSNVKICEINGSSTKFENNSFDIVFAADVLEHFRNLESPIKEIHRILKPGGKLIVNSPIEAGFFNFARSLAGFDKPSDHYHSADDISHAISRYFDIGEKYNFPPLRGFRILEIIKAIKVVK